MQIMLVDAHCHLDEIPDYQPEQNVLSIPCGHSHSVNQKIVEIAKRFGLPFVLGIAPQTAQKEDLSNLGEWIQFIRNAKPNAIGEIGLDFHWAKTAEQKEKQYLVFEKMLDLAETMQLPIVLHCREAGDEMLKILEKQGIETPNPERKTQNAKPKMHAPQPHIPNPIPGAMWHFFSGTEAQAKKALQLGLLLSFPPLPSTSRKRALLLAPLDRILAETDAPIGARTPAGVEKAIEYIAEVKGLPIEAVVRETTENAARFFGISLPYRNFL